MASVSRNTAGRWRGAEVVVVTLMIYILILVLA
jgi:hypothetical protein